MARWFNKDAIMSSHPPVIAAMNLMKVTHYRAAHSYESSDEGSPETHAESDMDSDIRADIEAETAAAAMTAAAIVDGLGIEPDMAVVETGFKPGLAVVESESELEEAEADYEVDAEIQPEGTIEIGVNVTTGIDIPHDLPMPDTNERIGHLEESVQGMYRRMLEIPLQRIEDIEAGQTDQQVRNMIADGERSSLLERVADLEGSNTRLRDTLGVEKVSADSFQRRLGYVEDELRQIRELLSHESQRLWRMETFFVTPPNWVAAEYGSGACYFSDQ
ncbi:hypothetical protein Tco_1074754 [Tanacetum coccineum]